MIGAFLISPVKITHAAEVWQQVGGNGLGDPTNTVIASMESWNGALYAAVGRDSGSNARIYRSTDGNNWSLVKDGFGHDNLNVTIDFASFNNRLYVSVSNESFGLEPAEIWSTADGLTWTQSGDDGLGMIANTEFYDFETFNSQLYVGSFDIFGGANLFRTTDGSTWDLIASEGFGDGDNIAIWGLKSFGGYLWAGTENTNGAQIWRSTTGNLGSWTKYWDYATIVPAEPQFTAINNFYELNNTLFWGAISTTGARIMKRVSESTTEGGIVGLGDTNNIWISDQTVTEDGLIYLGTRNQITGGELWYTSDGLNATQIGQDGFGDSNNFAIYALTYQNYLYIAFSNSNGISIWRRTFSSSFGIKTKKLPDGQQYSDYTATIEPTGGTDPYNYSIAKGSLPEGLVLNATTGEISGNPKVAGDFQFTIQVEDGSKKHSKIQRIYTLKIVAAVSDIGVGNITVLPQTGADLGL